MTGTRNYLTPEERKKVFVLLCKGLAPKTVAYELGRGYTAIRRIKNRMKAAALSRSPEGRPARKRG